MDVVDHLITAQSAESMENINIREVLDVLSSDALTKSETLIKLCERISFLIFDHSNYGIRKIEDPLIRSILHKIICICQTSIDSDFSFIKGPEYFAGNLPTTSSSSFYGSVPNYTTERVLSAFFVSSGILKKQDFLDQLEKLDSFYSSTRCLAESLINNDDRCLTVIAALLPYIEMIPESSIFYPPSLFFEVLNLVHYDSEIIIDWFTSEIISSLLFLRVLKMMCDTEKVKSWKNIKPSPTPISNARWCSYNSSSSKKPDVSLNIIELAGEMKSVRTFEFTCLEEMVYNPALDSSTVETTDDDILWMKWVELVGVLKIKLRRMEETKLTAISFSTLIKWCERFCEINC